MFESAKELLERIKENEKSLRVPVMIPHDEVDRIVVNRLIGMRNAEINRNKDKTSLDTVLRYFLTEEEFTDYVIKGKKVT